MLLFLALKWPSRPLACNEQSSNKHKSRAMNERRRMKREINELMQKVANDKPDIYKYTDSIVWGWCATVTHDCLPKCVHNMLFVLDSFLNVHFRRDLDNPAACIYSFKTFFPSTIVQLLLFYVTYSQLHIMWLFNLVLATEEAAAVGLSL